MLNNVGSPTTARGTAWGLACGQSQQAMKTLNDSKTAVFYHAVLPSFRIFCNGCDIFCNLCFLRILLM